jgi:hypothetical protein
MAKTTTKKTKKPKFNSSIKESIEVYTEGLEETLEVNGIDPADCWEIDPDEIDDPDLAWLLGWFAAVAESHDCLPEHLVTLSAAPEAKTKTKLRLVK